MYLDYLKNSISNSGLSSWTGCTARACFLGGCGCRATLGPREKSKSRILLTTVCTYSINSFPIYFTYLHTRATTTMSDLFMQPEHLKLNHYNNMTWRNPFRVDLPAVDAYEITIGDENHPIGAGNTAAIRAQPQDSKTRRKELSSARAPKMPSPNQLHRQCKWILRCIKGKIRCIEGKIRWSTTAPP